MRFSCRYIGDLVQRLNTLTTDYDEALSELSEYRNQLGDNVRPVELRRKHEDHMNSLLDNKVLLKILEDQVIRTINDSLSKISISNLVTTFFSFGRLRDWKVNVLR